MEFLFQENSLYETNFKNYETNDLFLFVMLFQVTAGVFTDVKAQIQLKAQNESVREVLQSIEDQIGYRFMYNANNIDTEREINIEVKDKAIEDVLAVLFEGTDVKYRSFGDNYVLYEEESEINTYSQQQRTITGIVTDEGGEPLPGVPVAQLTVVCW